jgi:hypothetical protein
MKLALSLVCMQALVGCPKPSKPTPPVAPSKVVFSWKSTGNPSIRACGTGIATPCLKEYTLCDGNTLIARPAIGTFRFTLSPLPAAGSHDYSLVVNVLNADGSITASPKALSMQAVP